VNQYELVSRTETSDRGHIFSGGVSRRDFDSLFDAVRDLPYPVIVVTCSDDVLAAHGSSLNEAAVPSNVQIIRTDGGLRPFLDYMASSRLVVIPLRKDTVT